MVTTKMFGLMRRIAQERDGVTTEGRNLIGEAMRDRPYNPNPWATQRLAEAKAGVGVPIVGSNVPNNVVMEQDGDGRWIANGGRWGPFDTVRDLEIAVYGRSDLSAGKRDWRDEAPKAG